MDPAAWPQFDATRWPALRAEFEGRFVAGSREHWEAVFADVDACVVPVLGLDEALTHPHNLARGTFTATDASAMPAPAPRFSRGGGEVRLPAPRAGEHTDEVLASVGLDAAAIAGLRADGVVV
jgi:alpha-methylacyl-CoA racemase